MAPVRLCDGNAIEEGQSRGFDPWQQGKDTVFVVRYRQRLHAWFDACPHYDGTPMAWRKDQYLNASATRIVCAAHGAEFDIETGVCTLGPCLGRSLRKVALAVTKEDEIFIGPQGEEETSHDK